MSVEDDFTARLRQNPEDEANRAIFADWLEEQGRIAEAMFIRYPPEKISLEFKFKTRPVGLIKCPSCKRLAYFRETELGLIGANVECPSRYRACSGGPKPILEPGTTYRFCNGDYQYYGGIDGKWFVRIAKFRKNTQVKGKSK